jgi:F0F1-type ATP synthase beta subunit
MKKKETIRVFSQISQKLAQLKFEIANTLSNDDRKYMHLREYINDCQEIMSIHCDCAPIKLINGNIDDIYKNANKS